jgi:hypothetical protein
MSLKLHILLLMLNICNSVLYISHLCLVGYCYHFGEKSLNSDGQQFHQVFCTFSLGHCVVYPLSDYLFGIFKFFFHHKTSKYLLLNIISLLPLQFRYITGFCTFNQPTCYRISKVILPVVLLLNDTNIL